MCDAESKLGVAWSCMHISSISMSHHESYSLWENLVCGWIGTFRVYGIQKHIMVTK